MDFWISYLQPGKMNQLRKKIEMIITPESFNRLVMERRSVFPKQFDTTKKVPNEIVQQIITNATWAPNHGQSEPWFFKVFTGKGLETFAK